MAELQNPKHEKFGQNILRGLTPTEAYISAGYSRKGAASAAARLCQVTSVCARIQLSITERDERLVALQDRWDALRQAKAAFAVGDYAAAMKTGVVCRKTRSVGSGKDARIVEEYEINTALIECLNSVEKRAAIETGQEQENVNLTGQISRAGIDAAKVFTLEEMERRYNAKFEEERQAKAQAKLLPAPGER